MPVGTGTFYVRPGDPEGEEEEEANCPAPKRKKSREEWGPRLDGPLLRAERAGLNVTQREESLVVQYLTLGGFRH